MNTDSFSQQFSNRIRRYALISRYLKPSLMRRLHSEHWYESRIIRYILRNSAWVDDLEVTFREAKLDSICNSKEILGVLQGTELDYDETLFDALAEVRLARWARSCGYQEIEKLQTEFS